MTCNVLSGMLSHYTVTTAGSERKRKLNETAASCHVLAKSWRFLVFDVQLSALSASKPVTDHNSSLFHTYNEPSL